MSTRLSCSQELTVELPAILHGLDTSVRMEGAFHGLVLDTAWDRTDSLAKTTASAVLRNDLCLVLRSENDGLVSVVVARHVALATLNAELLDNDCHHLLLSRQIRMLLDTFVSVTYKIDQLCRHNATLLLMTGDVILLAATSIRDIFYAQEFVAAILASLALEISIVRVGIVCTFHIFPVSLSGGPAVLEPIRRVIITSSHTVQHCLQAKTVVIHNAEVLVLNG